MFGNGSDGALTVTNGNYALLEPDQQYQYTSVNIQAGGSLYAYDDPNGTGAVLYIQCTGTFTLDGTIDLTYVTNPGNNGYSATVNGEFFSAAGVQAGGAGGSKTGAAGGVQTIGHGGGGAGGAAYLVGQAVNPGGVGGIGGTLFTGGASSNVGPTGTNGYYTAAGNAGINQKGGGGAAMFWRNVVTGTMTGRAQGGGSGGNASTTLAGNWSNASSNFVMAAGGGGGFGGGAGYSGLHLVIKAPTIILRGTVLVAGMPGQDAQTGGAAASDWAQRYSGVYPAPPSYVAETGASGGGGGGGNGANIKLVYSTSLTNTATIDMSGGAGGVGANNGTAGTSGSLTVQLASASGMLPFFI